MLTGAWDSIQTKYHPRTGEFATVLKYPWENVPIVVHYNVDSMGEVEVSHITGAQWSDMNLSTRNEIEHLARNAARRDMEE